MKQFTRIEPTTIQPVGLRFKRAVVVKRFRTDDGLEHEFTTWLQEGTHAGGVIAITPDKQVVTVRQFRPGPERWVDDIPGGGFHDGEDFQVAACRELKEETGYEVGRIEFLGTSFRDAYNNCTWHYYLATDCVPSKDGSRPDEEEDDQGAELRLISIDELIDNARHDRMSDPHAVLMAYEKLKALKDQV